MIWTAGAATYSEIRGKASHLQALGVTTVLLSEQCGPESLPWRRVVMCTKSGVYTAGVDFLARDPESGLDFFWTLAFEKPGVLPQEVDEDRVRFVLSRLSPEGRKALQLQLDTAISEFRQHGETMLEQANRAFRAAATLRDLIHLEVPDVSAEEPR